MNLAPALAEAPLWAVTSYFNTQGFRLRRENYRRFRRHLRAPLATIEWSPTGRFELGDDEADLMVRVEGGSPMWQKERLLNLLIPRLPPACRAVAWLDCDVVFNREDWVGATLQALERHTLVQLFEHAHHLTEAGSARLDEADWSALPHELSRQGVVAACPPPLSLGEWARQQTAVRPGGLSTGFAWAAPRAWLEQHPFIDTWLLGGGDAPSARPMRWCSGMG
jgi:hypothetical protein